MGIFKNRFFLICLCVALVLCAVPSVFSVMGYRTISRSIVGVVTFPVRWCVSAVADGFEGLGRYLSGVSRLESENEALRAENEALRTDAEKARLLEAENERMRSYFGMKELYPNFRFEEGTVIGQSADNNVTVYTLNKGTAHGIKLDMPVLVSGGLVGCVSEVGLTYCKVSTIVQADCSLGGYIPRSAVSGIVCGDYALAAEGKCKLTYVDGNADVQVGDTVYSSGTGSKYPANVPIGQILSVEIDEYSRTLTAVILPLADLSGANRMIIMTGYES